MNITCHEENGYLIPNIVLAHGCDSSTPIGKYRRMRWRYLQGQRPVLFNVMVQSGTLFDHLIETENAARSRLDVMIPELAKSAGATEKLKSCRSDEMGGNYEFLQDSSRRNYLPRLDLSLK